MELQTNPHSPARDRPHPGGLGPEMLEYWAFARTGLRNAVAEDIPGFFEAMLSPEPNDYLHRLAAIASLPGARSEAFDYYRAIRVRPGAVNSHPAIFLEMPDPEASSLPYFIAIVWRWRSSDPRMETEPAFRYFLVERNDGTFPAFLCERAGHGHLNLGPLPDTTLSAFTTALETLLP